MTSGSNGNNFVYSGDIALLLLICDKKLKPFKLEIASQFETKTGIPVITAGFPRPPEDPLYCCPTLYHSTEEKIKREVNIAFNNFKSLVYSDGIIAAQTENLIDINCLFHLYVKYLISIDSFLCYLCEVYIFTLYSFKL